MRTRSTRLRPTFIHVALLLLQLTACRPAHVSLGMPAPKLPTPSPAPTSEPAVAQVGGESISQADYDLAVKQLSAAGSTLGQELSSDLLDQRALESLVDDTLLAQAATRAGYLPNQADLDRRAAALVEWGMRAGYSAAQLQSCLRRQIAAAWQRDQIISSVPTAADQVHARQILTVERSTAQTALQELQSGDASWDDLAELYAPQTGGDLGWFPRGYLTQPGLDAAAFALQPGQLSPVIETALGFHILQVTAVQTGRLLTPEARRALQHRALKQWLADQRMQSRIEETLPGSTQTSAVQSAAAPFYRAQAGDSFALVARKFRVSVSELLAANPDVDPNVLELGVQLAIPGRQVGQGELQIEKMPVGIPLSGLARHLQLPMQALIALNRLSSPAELYAGSALILPAEAGLQSGSDLPALQAGQTLLEYAANERQDPWLLALANQADTPLALLPDDPIFLRSALLAGSQSTPGSILDRVQIDPQAFQQGSTVVIQVGGGGPVTLTGQLDGRELHFFQEGSGGYVAIQGIHAMAEPGLTDFSVAAVSAAGGAWTYEQSMWLKQRDFIQDPPLQVDPETIDPAVTKPEEDLIASVTAAATPHKWWEGLFFRPVDPSCAPSGYGNRRSYNGSAYTYFHAGLDWGLCDTDTIFAPAPGVVVYTGSLIVRGNATIIDHGWGIYTGYWHQSEIDVKVGDRVVTGQPIGKIGATGRVTGAHLHWEVWANGVQVDPLAWLRQAYP
jgi:murein DD-endopeptidase MepM/ murein hydrolase activator NlpD/parvulin-like peptidyl-prolyl isomerase